ncbi:hypothetical protein GGR21_001219 [Dysgonomonas hofstadii]|uniref:Fimbrillin-A associated anchor protein Mfa1 and Mfa2 n=1 Tax=Dysgonomonas hofstadii TaxID=637886 RepID=A0A840CHA5_9BACT|nr:hypothetical protein [Dysgonomonas hofstadii]MBB4035330.1 hypothetical protein [Dysgonomonas hofstadii]
MNKRYSSQVLYLLVISLVILLVPSCTYDYFEDETNYEIYVPKADKNLRTETYGIEDLSIFIYNDVLQKERYSHNPFSENARSLLGNFNFRLYPGNYNVYCFTNVQDIYFQDLNTYSEARFDLKQSTDGTYEEPSAIYVDYKNTTINFPGPVVSDTALLESKYVGRICVAFKNLTEVNSQLTKANIKEVRIEATGIGTTQYLSKLTSIDLTRSSRKTPGDKMKLVSTVFDLEYKDFPFGIQNYYYPSPDLTEEEYQNIPIDLTLSFIGLSGETIYEMSIAVVDKAKNPLVLHMNETLVVEVDGNNIQILHLDDIEDWNPQIEVEGGSGSGSGGIDA